jgi:tetratricopeptide (TPR) repeat protein
VADTAKAYTKRLNTKTLILLLLCSSLVLAASTVGAWAGSERANSSGSLRSMARVYMACGAHEKAEPLLERALRLARSTNAADCEVCACLIDLAYLYKNQGKLAEAEKMCRSGLSLQEKVYHRDHPHVAYTLRILSEIHQGQARYGAAASALERAIDIMGRANGASDQELAPFKADMARLLTARGDFAKAESYFKEAIASIDGGRGARRLYVANVSTNLAELYVLQERYDRAAELIKRALAEQERVHGADHHFLVPAWLVMARIHQVRGKPADAKMLLDKSLRVVENQPDCGYLVKGDVLTRLGQFYIASEEYARAEDVLQRALKVLDSSQAPHSDRVAVACSSLAKVYISQGKYSRAGSLCRRALNILEGILEAGHPYMADVQQTLIQLQRRSGDTVLLARLERRAEESREREQASSTPIAAAVE